MFIIWKCCALFGFVIESVDSSIDISSFLISMIPVTMWRSSVLPRVWLGISNLCKVSGTRVAVITTTPYVFEAAERPFHLQLSFGCVGRRRTNAKMLNPRDYHVLPVLVRGLHGMPALVAGAVRIPQCKNGPHFYMKMYAF